MPRRSRYAPEVRERAVRLVFDHEDEYESQWKAIVSIADKIGCSSDTVEEVASLLGLGRTAAYEAARRGQIPSRRLGRRVVIPVPALLMWLAADLES